MIIGMDIGISKLKSSFKGLFENTKSNAKAEKISEQLLFIIFGIRSSGFDIEMLSAFVQQMDIDCTYDGAVFEFKVELEYTGWVFFVRRESILIVPESMEVFDFSIHISKDEMDVRIIGSKEEGAVNPIKKSAMKILKEKFDNFNNAGFWFQDGVEMPRRTNRDSLSCT